MARKHLPTKELEGGGGWVKGIWDALLSHIENNWMSAVTHHTLLTEVNPASSCYCIPIHRVSWRSHLTASISQTLCFHTGGVNGLMQRRQNEKEEGWFWSGGAVGEVYRLLERKLVKGCGHSRTDWGWYCTLRSRGCKTWVMKSVRRIRKSRKKAAQRWTRVYL